jgi:hypothetical protein
MHGLERHVLRVALSVGCAGVMAIAMSSSAFALQTPTTGQPGAPTNTCGPDNTVTPGNSVTASGSVFNPNGQAGTVYAGNPGTASLANSNSAVAISQYDTACVQLSH